MKRNLPLILTVIALGAAFRLFDSHIFNFTPVGAIALFSGAMLGRSYKAMLIPIALMFISDLALQLTGKVGFHAEMPFVYGAFLITFFIGKFGLGKKHSVGRVLGASLTSSLAFFVITNFGSWILSPAYSKDIAGLITCYIAAIPFYNPHDYLSSFALNGILGDLFFNLILFGSYYLATNNIGKLTSISVRSKD